MDNPLIIHQMDNAKSQDDIELSIVIVTHYANQDFLLCVQSTLALMTSETELIVVNNGANEEVIGAIQTLPIRYYHIKSSHGPCLGRNFGSELAHGRWILYLDDDGLPQDDLIRNALELIKEPDFYAARGRVVPKTDTIFNAFQSHYDAGDDAIPFSLNLEGITLINKDKLLSVGAWNTELFGHEGEELSFRLVQKYGQQGCQYQPGLVLRHDFSDSLLKLLDKVDRTENPLGRSIKSNPEIKALFRQFRRFAYPDKRNLVLDSLFKRLQYKLCEKVLHAKRRGKLYANGIHRILRRLQRNGIRI